MTDLRSHGKKFSLKSKFKHFNKLTASFLFSACLFFSLASFLFCLASDSFLSIVSFVLRSISTFSVVMWFNVTGKLSLMSLGWLMFWRLHSELYIVLICVPLFLRKKKLKVGAGWGHHESALRHWLRSACNCRKRKRYTTYKAIKSINDYR